MSNLSHSTQKIEDGNHGAPTIPFNLLFSSPPVSFDAFLKESRDISNVSISGNLLFLLSPEPAAKFVDLTVVTPLVIQFTRGGNTFSFTGKELQITQFLTLRNVFVLRGTLQETDNPNTSVSLESLRICAAGATFGPFSLTTAQSDCSFRLNINGFPTIFVPAGSQRTRIGVIQEVDDSIRSFIH
ncbi:hypothetical protein IC619_016045 [Hazenella sp. IB182353]|uniref:hypothetical protein n=1 Tax=Polycladospora coralii TaxID=2771432 RepID=UPI0017465511|nr:hypothetical protein [Polycladospora coralii]MBS7531964.1 hypothetical protein [Polycladospora coralii]